MGVVINEFEVLSEPQPEPRRDAAETSGPAAAADKSEPIAVAAALRVLHQRALRTWSH